MGEVINIEEYPLLSKKDSKESDIAMFTILYFNEHFSELYSDLEIEIQYALIISMYRYMVDAEKAGDVEISEDGFSIALEASKILNNKLKAVVKKGGVKPKDLN